ncbi:hypothetical protein WJX72_007821 [[Myrmecia] bisecta]|uniref:CBS domain-containing protein n=1 Tax=[Myrmecia] bisecta TaxID=41462 RepID=A0AAW1R817_9CHLO
MASLLSGQISARPVLHTGLTGSAKARQVRNASTAGFLTVPAAARPVPALRASNEPIGDLTGEWPVNWSLASYEDVSQFFQDKLFKEGASPGTTLGEVMSTRLTTTTPDTKLESVAHLFEDISGLPVVKSKEDPILIGVLSKKDLEKGGKIVKDVYSHPPIAATTSNNVAHAACLMLKHKVHRIPIVDDKAKLVGIVTRTDIFTALALEVGDTEVLTE